MPHALVKESWSDKETVHRNVVKYVLNLINRLKICPELEEKSNTVSQEKRKIRTIGTRFLENLRWKIRY